MWKIDPTGSYEFSDATNRDQLTLFASKPDFGQLRRLIMARFAGSTVSVGEVERFVVVETAFRETHYKKQILAPMENEGLLHVVSERKKRLSYPAGTMLCFG